MKRHALAIVLLMVMAAIPASSQSSEIISNQPTFQRDGASTYLTRKYSDFKQTGIAYRFLPSDLKLDEPVNVTLRHEGKLFDSTSGIFVFYNNDESVEEMCNVTVLKEVSALLDETGGIVTLDDMTLDFPENSLLELSQITIKKLDLVCVGERERPLLPPDYTPTVRTVSATDYSPIILVVGAILAIVIVLWGRKI